MKPHWVIQLVIFFTGVLCSALSSAEETTIAATSLNFSKIWFKPELIESNHPVCKDILTLTDTAFFSDSETLYKGFAKELGKTFTIYQKPAEITLEGKTIYTTIYRLKGCGGYCEQDQLLTSTTKIPDAQNNAFYETLLASAPPPSPGHLPLYASSDNANYFYFSFAENLNIYQLQANASWQQICVIATKPTDEKLTTSSRTEKIAASIKALNQSIDKISGDYGSCGSMQSGGRAKQAIKAALPAAIYRPWAMYENENTPNSAHNYPRDLVTLEIWSKMGLDEHNKFLAYQQQFAKTSKQLSHFYQTSYGWSKQHSELLANNALGTAISSGFIFGTGIPISSQDKQLREAILQKKPISEVQSYLIDYAKIDRPASGYGVKESIVNFAITYPEMLTFLLDKNISPNIANEFGKTPLMYAAQYNQLQSVKILLDRGANPNAFTIIPSDDCNYTLTKSKMTALHYAVRYASPELIELLISRGANPYAKTSQEQAAYPIDWLHTYTGANAAEPNPNIATAQIAKVEKWLALPGAEEIKRKTLEYNLQAEKEYKDGNINLAYELVLKAININEKDDRAQANMGLIALKAGKEDEALEATQNLIANSQDAAQKANAWFNYGLICEKRLPLTSKLYNGHYYCNSDLVLSYIESYKYKPTPARANKIISLITDNKIAKCDFSKDNTRIIISNSGQNYTHSLIVLQPNSKILDSNDISWIRHQYKAIDGSVVSEATQMKSTSVQAVYDLGEYRLSIINSKDSIDFPVQFAKEICSEKYEIKPAPNP